MLLLLLFSVCIIHVHVFDIMSSKTGYHYIVRLFMNWNRIFIQKLYKTAHKLLTSSKKKLFIKSTWNSFWMKFHSLSSWFVIHCTCYVLTIIIWMRPMQCLISYESAPTPSSHNIYSSTLIIVQLYPSDMLSSWAKLIYHPTGWWVLGATF